MSKLPTHLGGRPFDPQCRGLVLDIDRFASHDGPGIRTAVFLKGCPLSCIWCHSPESQAPRREVLYQPQRCTGCWLCLEECPESALSRGETQGKEAVVLDRARCTDCGRCAEVCYPGAIRVAGTVMSAGELVDKVAKDKPFFARSGGGVTLSGGEPAMQADFAYNLLLGCKEHDIHTALETTGLAPWEVVSALAEVTDLLLYDVKLLDSGLHRKYTRVPNRLILENLRRLARSGHSIQVRVPCIPGINDSLEHILSLALAVADMGIARIALLPYNAAAGAKYEWTGRRYALAHLETQPEAHLAALAKACEEAGLSAQIGG